MTSTIQDRVDGITSAMAWKVPCKLATTANVTLSGLQTIDGVAGATDDRILVRSQTTTTENGIYTMQSGAWERAADFDGNRDVTHGTMVLITHGSTLALKIYRVSSANPIVIGTDAITFAAAATFS